MSCRHLPLIDSPEYWPATTSEPSSGFFGATTGICRKRSGAIVAQASPVFTFFSFAKQETKGSGLRYSGCGRSRGRPHFFLHPRKSPPHFPSHKCPGMHRKGVMADDVSRSSACKCRKGEAERSSSRRYFRIFVFFPPEKREQLCFAPIGTLPGFWQACHLGRLFRQMAESFLRDRNENPGRSEHDRDPATHRRDA